MRKIWIRKKKVIGNGKKHVAMADPDKLCKTKQKTKKKEREKNYSN